MKSGNTQVNLVCQQRGAPVLLWRVEYFPAEFLECFIIATVQVLILAMKIRKLIEQYPQLQV